MDSTIKGPREEALESVQEEAFTARVGVKYHSKLSARNARYGWLSNILIMFAGFGALLAALGGPRGVAALFGAVIIVVGAWAIVNSYSSYATRHEMLRNRWRTLRYSLEQLGRDIDRLPDGPVPDDCLRQFKPLMTERWNIVAEEGSVTDRKLLEVCQSEVLQEIGEVDNG